MLYFRITLILTSLLLKQLTFWFSSVLSIRNTIWTKHDQYNRKTDKTESHNGKCLWNFKLFPNCISELSCLNCGLKPNSLTDGLLADEMCGLSGLCHHQNLRKHFFHWNFLAYGNECYQKACWEGQITNTVRWNAHVFHHVNRLAEPGDIKDITRMMNTEFPVKQK